MAIQPTLRSRVPTRVNDLLRGIADVRLGERAALRRAAVSAGAKADELVRAAQVRRALVVLAFQASHVDQERRGSRFACHGMKRHNSRDQSSPGRMSFQRRMTGSLPVVVVTQDAPRGGASKTLIIHDLDFRFVCVDRCRIRSACGQIRAGGMTLAITLWSNAWTPPCSVVRLRSLSRGAFDGDLHRCISR